MLWKNLVLKFEPEMLSGKQFAEFFNTQYFKGV